MDRLEVIANHDASDTETVPPAYVPPLQLTDGQPSPIAANGGLSYMAFEVSTIAPEMVVTPRSLMILPLFRRRLTRDSPYGSLQHD